jgi:hypothetical protein
VCVFIKAVMEIVINDSRTISEIQADFSKAFPYLKLEFFSAAPAPKDNQQKSKMFSPERTLESIRKIHANGVLKISGTKTVADLKNILCEKHGLYPQVFRKSANLWIETSLTDSWTLERQNREGGEMSNA